VGTLLGPEETSMLPCGVGVFGSLGWSRPGVAAHTASRLWGWVCGGCAGFCALFENCTVDASIFVVK
jgi:hypothetical protein